MRQVVERPKCHARGRGLVQQATGSIAVYRLLRRAFPSSTAKTHWLLGMEKKVLSNFLLPSLNTCFQNAITFSHKRI